MEATDVNQHVDASAGRILGGARATVSADTVSPVDVQAVRLLLSGGSVVDWRRLLFHERDEVVGFLAVNGYDVSCPAEMSRLATLHGRAIAYLEETYEFSVPVRIREPSDLCDLFLAASGVDATRAEQQAACAVLKVVHVLNHLEARRLVHHLSVSERALFLAAANKVELIIHEMRRDRIGIRDYQPSTKSDHSLVTKLISKPRVTAAQIFDKLRFRLVAEERADLAEIVRWLLRQLFPFNHVIAGESHNTILTAEELTDALEGRLSAPLGTWSDFDEGYHPRNPATSPSFRMINFVVDLPVRINRLCSPEDLVRLQHLGHLVHVTLEFQLFDAATVRNNESGEGNHVAYKQRQLQLVSERLWGGLRPRLSDSELHSRQSRKRFDVEEEL